MNPIYGLEAPAAGQVRYLSVRTSQSTPTKPTCVAQIHAGTKRHNVEVPAGSTFTGRLVDDRSNVVAGAPVVSAKYVGYGIVADIDGKSAYKIAGALTTVKAQIEGGPGPFTCTVLGTIAALPEGTVPAPPAQPDPAASGAPVNPFAPPQQPQAASDPTGLRLVCITPPEVKMINGAAVTLELVTASASNAMVLPVEAVAGIQGSGKVDVVQGDGTRVSKDVVLGLTDGKFVEIKSGLTGEENIAVPAPSLTEVKQDPNMPGPK